jgi:hypothetical protein
MASNRGMSAAIESAMTQVLPPGDDSSERALDLGLQEAGAVWIAETELPGLASRQAAPGGPAAVVAAVHGHKAGPPLSLDRRA